MKKVLSLLCLTLAVLICASSCKDNDEPTAARTSIVGATYTTTQADEDASGPVTLDVSFPTSTQYSMVSYQKNTITGETTEVTISGPYTVASDLITCSAKGVSITYKRNGVIVPVMGAEGSVPLFEPIENIFRIGKDYETITLINSDGEEENIVFTLKK